MSAYKPVSRRVQHYSRSAQSLNNQLKFPVANRTTKSISASSKKPSLICPIHSELSSLNLEYSLPVSLLLVKVSHQHSVGQVSCTFHPSSLQPQPRSKLPARPGLCIPSIVPTTVFRHPRPWNICWSIYIVIILRFHLPDNVLGLLYRCFILIFPTFQEVGIIIPTSKLSKVKSHDNSIISLRHTESRFEPASS